MRYIIALVVAALLIGGVVLYIRNTDRAIEQAIRQALLNQKLAGTLPPELQGIDPQTADLSKLGDFGMKLPAALEHRLQLTYYLTDFWYIWAPLIVLVCMGAAVLFGIMSKAQK
jgi:hypothetical protein